MMKLFVLLCLVALSTQIPARQSDVVAMRQLMQRHKLTGHVSDIFWKMYELG